jgi:hypothetical protein
MTNNDNTNEGNEMKSTTMTYREWLIAHRNENMTPERLRRTWLNSLTEKEALAEREKAKSWNPSA